jgi:hypothetical protein
VGHIAAFCENKKEKDKESTTNVTITEVHKEATQQLLNAVKEDDEDYYADLFVCDGDEHFSASFYCDGLEHSSASFQLKDGVNGGRIPKDWILLDSQSTTDAFSNPALLTDIHEVPGSLTIHTQAGKTVTKL